MKREVLAYIKQNKMIEKNDVVLAGVSGGSDSMAMLRILKELQPELKFMLRVVHVHHGIRGQEADRDSSFVENICREWQIPCMVYYYDVPKLSRKKSVPGIRKPGSGSHWHITRRIWLRP